MDPVKDGFDPKAFRDLGHAAVDQLADYLETVSKGEGRVRPAQEPDKAATYWGDQLHEEACQNPTALIAQVLERSFHSHHPRNLGHQVGPVLPLAAVFELVGSLLDTGNGVYEVGDPATPMERAVLKDLNERIGLPKESDGILTSGGSLGNLTALLAMRQCQTGSWDEGTSHQQFAVLVSSEAHYCVERAVKIMGWGEQGIIRVPVDDEYRMRIDALEACLAEAQDDHIQVLGVVGSAGSTATGKIDPLAEIATFCQRHSLWFHVDAAHAGAFVFSEKARPLLRGWERADSIVIDFHKMLLSPSLLTAVLFRLGRDSYQSFAQKADYLWRADQTQEWWDLAKRTVECTRPMLGLRAYALLKHGGERLFEAYIDQALAATETFASLIESSSDFELLTTPESNILCYRHTPNGLDKHATDQLNQKIRAAITADGKFYIVQVEKHGRTYLRSAVMNPFVTIAVFEELLDEIRRISRKFQEL